MIATEILKLTPKFLSKDNSENAVKEYLDSTQYTKWKMKWQQDLEDIEAKGVKI